MAGGLAVGVIGYTDAGVPCGTSHPRCTIPDEIVLEIRDRAENRREAIAAIAADLQARDYVVTRRQVHRIAVYEQRAALPHEWRRESPLRCARRARSLTVAGLAAAAGVSRHALMRAELGRSAPKAETLRRIAEALGVDTVVLGVRCG